MASRFVANQQSCLWKKCVFIDQGNELWANPDILKVFTNYHYEVLSTGTKFSQQNGPVKRAHCTVSYHVRKLVLSTSIQIKSWLYTFFHHPKISIPLALNGQNSSQIFQPSKRKIICLNSAYFVCCYVSDLLGREKLRSSTTSPRVYSLVCSYNCDTAFIGPTNHISNLWLPFCKKK